MKRLVLLVVLMLAGSQAASAEEDLGQARRLLRSGKYAEAAEIYGRDAKTPEATLGLARTLAAQGKEDQAIAALESASEKHADLHAELARLAFERGDIKAATAEIDAALAKNSNQLLARWLRGEVLRATGKLDEAAAAYRWLVDFYNEQDVTDAESLRWIGLAAAQNARWKRFGDQFQFLVNDLYPAALELEPDYWPARYEAGLLYLEKHNREDASRELKAALELNPNAAEVHAALARLAIESRQVEQAEASIRRALEINPRLLEAQLLKAELAWANFRPDEAARILQQDAQPLNPVCEATLGRLAACYVLQEGPPEQGQNTRLAQLVDQVTARNPHAGAFFLALAGWLDDRNRFAEAETYYRESIARMPQQLGPKAQWSMMRMRSGDEREARKILQEAFDDDPFNVRVKNSLELLDVMDSFETVRTKDCILRFDGRRDKLLGRYAAQHADRIYADLCARFGYRPAEPPLVEFFGEARGADGHQWFSTRMVGLPHLGTVAASTGKIVGMVSPADRRVKKKFNWAQVLTHELVHVITLQQTHFNIPSWYTEGLAVWCEGYPRPAPWNELLARRAASGELYDLATLNFGFSRPQSGDDWQLAYCQAELYVEYMLEGRSPDVLKKLLDAYAENQGTTEAIVRVFGVSLEQFEEGYREYLKKVVGEVRGAGTPREEGFSAVLKAAQANPNDADRTADLAYAYLQRGAFEEALAAAEKAMRLRSQHPIAGYVLARLSLRVNRIPEAFKMLEDCLDPKAPEPKVINLLASLKFKAEEYAAAAKLYELGAAAEPHDPRWLHALALVYVKTQDRQRLRDVLEKIAQGEPDHLTARVELAKMALERQDEASARDWANQALEIDVTEATAHRILGEILADQQKHAQAIEEYEIALESDPSTPQTYLALADVYLQAEKPQEARRVLESLLGRFPDHAIGKTLLETLKETAKP